MLDFLKNKHFLLKFEKFESNFKWSRRQDSNLRPLVPKTSALPSCATSRFYSKYKWCAQRDLNP